MNAYAEPLVSLDLDLVVAVDQLEEVERLLEARFHVERFPHRLNVSEAGSQLCVQIQTDPRYFDFTSRAIEHDVLGLTLPVASIEDVLAVKIWVTQDPERRASKRRKDLLDIERLIEAHPRLRSRKLPQRSEQCSVRTPVCSDATHGDAYRSLDRCRDKSRHGTDESVRYL